MTISIVVGGVSCCLHWVAQNVVICMVVWLCCRGVSYLTIPTSYEWLWLVTASGKVLEWYQYVYWGRI